MYVWICDVKVLLGERTHYLQAIDDVFHFPKLYIYKYNTIYCTPYVEIKRITPGEIFAKSQKKISNREY